MQQNLLEEYTDFVDKVTSEASKSSDKMRERINYLNSKDIEMSRLLTAGIGLSGCCAVFISPRAARSPPYAFPPSNVFRSVKLCL